jgi:hypothetical protein
MTSKPPLLAARSNSRSSACRAIQFRIRQRRVHPAELTGGALQRNPNASAANSGVAIAKTTANATTQTR